MKKIFLIFCIVVLTACSSAIKITTSQTDPDITWDGKTLCIGKSFSASVNPADLAKGIKFGNDVDYILVKYVNGTLTAQVHGCYQLVK